MPAQGEIRRGATESVQWDGTRWAPVPVQPSSWLDSVPGLRDIAALPSNLFAGAKALPDVARGLVHEPAETLKGFAQGASEAATPDRVGLLSLLTAGATVPAALAAAGGETAVQATRLATDAQNQPQSLPDAAGEVATAAAIPLSAAALKAVPGAVERMGGSRNVATRTIGAGFGGYEGYRYGGIPGAVLGAVAGFKAPDLVGSRTLRALRSVVGDVESAAPPATDASEIPVTRPSDPSFYDRRFGSPPRKTPIASLSDGIAAPDLPKVPQGTWKATPDGEWTVDSTAKPGQRVNVMNRAGYGQMVDMPEDPETLGIRKALLDMRASRGAKTTLLK